jgi:tyrosinase
MKKRTLNVQHHFVSSSVTSQILIYSFADYSYPEVAGVKVDKPATAQQRIDARLALQKYYGLNPHTEKIILQFSNNPLFHLRTKAPAGHQLLPAYRHFVVVVQLLEHAYNRSYSFKLYHNDQPDDGDTTKAVLVGSVDVFARPDTSSCRGCSNRRKAGSIVRGVIRLRVHHVNAIIGLQPELDNKEVPESVLADHMKSNLTAVLANPQGDILACAGSQAEQLGPAGETAAMEEHMAPVKVTLLSSTASFATDAETGVGPVSLVYWHSAGWAKLLFIFRPISWDG